MAIPAMRTSAISAGSVTSAAEMVECMDQSVWGSCRMRHVIQTITAAMIGTRTSAVQQRVSRAT
jgi:hypothetical protein